MTRQFLFLVLVLTSRLSFGQDYPAEVGKAGEAYEQSKFDSCSFYFKKAFRIREGSGSDLYHGAICNALNQNSRQAFTLLNQSIGKGINISNLRIDPELGLLHQKKGWKKLMKRAATIEMDSFAMRKYPGYAAKLSKLYEADQYYRFRIGHAYRNNDTAAANNLWQLMRQSDSVNLIKFMIILDSIGWPTISKVGKWGASTAFLIIDHTPREVMEKYLPILEEAARNGEASKSSYATMKDRVLVNRNFKQIYGTQRHWDESQGKFVFFPIEDEKNVNQRRKEVGLPALKEFE